MTSSNGNIFRVTGPLCGEFTGPGEFPAQCPVTQSFDIFFDLRLTKNDWVNNREAGDLRRHRVHYDVNVMVSIWIAKYNSKIPAEGYIYTVAYRILQHIIHLLDYFFACLMYGYGRTSSLLGIHTVVLLQFAWWTARREVNKITRFPYPVAFANFHKLCP